MLNSLSKKSAYVRGCREVRKAPGAVDSRLATPTHVGAFLAPNALLGRKGLKMIPTTPRLDFAPSVNFARAYLFRAADALNDDRLIEAGALLREAIRQQCWAECCWFGCLPAGASEKTPPRTLLKALRMAGHCDCFTFDSVVEMIELGNALSHCKRVKPSYIRSSIVIFHGMIDASRKLGIPEPPNMAGHPQPECGPYEYVDDDDDEWDGANWWKPQGWTFGEGGAI